MAISAIIDATSDAVVTRRLTFITSLDFSKAFDAFDRDYKASVCHHFLLSWIRSYLTDCIERVVTNICTPRLSFLAESRAVHRKGLLYQGQSYSMLLVADRRARESS